MSPQIGEVWGGGFAGKSMSLPVVTTPLTQLLPQQRAHYTVWITTTVTHIQGFDIL